MAMELKERKVGGMAKLRWLPYAALGGLIFYLNADFEANYFVRGYLILMQMQVGAIALYWFSAKLSRNSALKPRSKP